MKTFEITVNYGGAKDYQIQAETEGEAIQKAKEAFYEEKHYNPYFIEWDKWIVNGYHV